MEPAPPALYAVFSSPLPGKQAEYEHWYDSIHVPDSLALGIFRAARRYAAAGASQAAYLTLWESDDPDLDAALERVRPGAQALRARGRVWAVQRILFHQFVFLRESEAGPRAEPVAALTSLLGCWAEPAADPAFRAWYADLAAEPGGPLCAYESRRVYAASGKTLVLLASSRPVEALAPLWAGRAQAGLPPFGPPTPIFRPGESPQEHAEPERVTPEQVERLGPAWVAHWRPVASRRVPPEGGP